MTRSEALCFIFVIIYKDALTQAATVKLRILFQTLLIHANSVCVFVKICG